MRLVRETGKYKLYFEPLQGLYRVVDTEGAVSAWFNDAREMKGLWYKDFNEYCGEMKFSETKEIVTKEKRFSI